LSDFSITVENLSKRFFVGHSGGKESYTALRDIISGNARDITRKLMSIARGQQIVSGREIEELWALRDVSFAIKPGEVIGIIGRNGAGKSTLLKILSRITDPTEGRVRIRGRVASLLEVGTGFHPELTGRENIYLNGAILGMSRADIDRKFDEIVQFAGTERFLDLPVKRYSSGMYVRLAFAVAAHIDPEILIVDEVLAVGDYEFQQKCLGKMQDVASREGRTVILVSHNLAVISEMANRAILLDSGHVITDGAVSDAISAYISKHATPAIYVRSSTKTPHAPFIRKAEVITSGENGTHHYGKPLTVKFWIRHNKPMSKGCFSFKLINYSAHAIVHACAFFPEYTFGSQPGETLLTCTFPHLRLNVGQFYLRTHLTEPPGREIYEELDGICQFEVVRKEHRLWGWNSEDCAYHEDSEWSVSQSDLG
jgi:homopolymeric O-antigen transport system ATP-binding protein